MDSISIQDFILRQLPVAGLLLGALAYSFSQYKKVLTSQQDTFTTAIKTIQEKNEQFWRERDNKVESIIANTVAELKEVSRQNRIANKMVIYQTINNPSALKKPREDKVDDILEILEGEKKQ